MNESDARFVASAVAKERLFKVLMWVGIAVGACLLVWSAAKGFGGESWGATFAIAILVLLNARGNLRQAKYARILREQLGEK